MLRVSQETMHLGMRFVHQHGMLDDMAGESCGETRNQWAGRSGAFAAHATANLHHLRKIKENEESNPCRQSQ